MTQERYVTVIRARAEGKGRERKGKELLDLFLPMTVVGGPQTEGILG